MFISDNSLFDCDMYVHESVLMYKIDTNEIKSRVHSKTFYLFICLFPLMTSSCHEVGRCIVGYHGQNIVDIFVYILPQNVDAAYNHKGKYYC